MITIGRRQKPLLVGAALLLVVLLVSITISTSQTPTTPLSSNVYKADYGIGDSVAPANGAGFAETNNDPNLLSGAKIEQDATAKKGKSGPHIVGSEKVDKISGSDASLKLKEESIEKAEKLTDIDSFADSKDSIEPNHSNKGGSKDSKGAAVAAADKNDKTSSSLNKGSNDKSINKGSAPVDEKKNYEYVIMIDAGSTGSRVHVYSFDTSSAPPVLIKEEFKMLKPGLSSFDTDTVGAAESLDPLLKLALDTIPKDKHSCSPVAVKATAGLRLLGDIKSKAILKEVRRHLEEDYPFPVVKGDGISIMDGSDEGVYAWITTNYLLQNIGTSKRLDTAAVFDLGGGSTQIVFEPKDGEKVLPGDHKYEIEFGGRKFTLYQYSHLGYGLMQARNKVNAEVLKSQLKTNKSKFTPLLSTEVKNAIARVTVENPCVPPGVTAENVVVEMENGDKYAVNFVSPSKDSANSLSSQCRLLTESILNKDLACESKSCSFNGIYQPKFDEHFPITADMYVFSYFYDRLQPIGMPDAFTLKEMTDIMQSVCAGSHLWDQYFTQAAHIKELEDEPLWCLDINFMISLLHAGYDIPLSRDLKTAKTIGGNELGWCLGASLPLLDKTNWTCRVTKEY
jgi:guanosine-diphosphatase